MSTHTKKPRKPRPDVARIGVAIPQDVRKRGMQLAGQEKRSFSNFVTMLIEREWERLGTDMATSTSKKQPA
jgi:hypothetical protein